MLAAAIRASLIEAGEPDTSAATPPGASQQRDSAPPPIKQHHHQQPEQQAGSQAPPSAHVSPFQTSSVERQLQQQLPAQEPRQHQKPKGKQHQLRFREEEMLNGHGFPPEHDSAAMLVNDSAAAMQETGSGGMLEQGISQRVSRQASNALPGGQLRTAWSSDGVVGRGDSAGSPQDASESGAGDKADVMWDRIESYGGVCCHMSCRKGWPAVTPSNPDTDCLLGVAILDTKCLLVVAPSSLHLSTVESIHSPVGLRLSLSVSGSTAWALQDGKTSI